MQLDSRNRVARRIGRVGSAFAVLLIGMVVATGSFWYLGQGDVTVGAVGWFVSWLIIWTSLPMFGRALHLNL